MFCFILTVSNNELSVPISKTLTNLKKYKTFTKTKFKSVFRFASLYTLFICFKMFICL